MPAWYDDLFGGSPAAAGSPSAGGAWYDDIFAAEQGEDRLARKKAEALERLRKNIGEMYPDLAGVPTGVEQGTRRLQAEGGPAKPEALERWIGPTALGAMEAVAPALAGGGTFMPAAAAITAAAAPTGPFAPVIGTVGGGVAAILAAYGVGKGQQKLMETMSPGSRETAAEVAAESPYLHLGGTLAAGGVAMKPALAGMTWAQRGAGAGLGAGFGALAPAITEGRKPTLGEVGLGAAIGAFTKARPWTGRYTGLSPASARRHAEARAVADAELLAQALAEEAANIRALAEAEAEPMPPFEPPPPPPEPTVAGVRPDADLPPEAYAGAAEAGRQRMFPREEAGWASLGEPVPVGPKRPGQAMREAQLARLQAQERPTAPAEARRVPEPDLLPSGKPTRNRALADAMDDLYRRIVEQGEEAPMFKLSALGAGGVESGGKAAWRALAQPGAEAPPSQWSPERMAAAQTALARKMGIEPPPRPAAAPGVPLALAKRAAAAPPPEGPVAKLIEVINSSLKGATVDRATQERLYHEARSAQAARIADARGLGGRRAALATRGITREKLPRVESEGLMSKLEPQDVDALYQMINEHPLVKSSQFDYANASDALSHLLEPGRVIQPAQITTLEKLFGPQLAEALMASRGRWEHAKQFALELASVPRAMVSSLDMSAPLRQGLLLTTSHPVKAAAAGKEMVKSWLSEGAYNAVMDDIHARPNAKLYDDAGLYLAEKWISKPGAQEEAFFYSRLAEKIPILGSQVIKRSERAYNVYLNKMRADVFDQLAAEYARGGELPSTNPLLYKSLAEYINIASGRGNLGKYGERAAPLLNAVFFSPRFVAARLQSLNPLTYWRMSPQVRTEAWRGAITLGGAGLTLLTLAKLAGAKVEGDPRSSDFGKVQVGQTRLDPWGGFQQYGRFITQLATAQRKTESGATMPVNRWDTLMDFAAGKLQPATGFIRDLLKGQGFAGQSLEAEKMLLERTLPLYLQDAMKAMGVEVSLKDLTVALHKAAPEMAKGFALSLPAFFGAGVQTYGEPIPPDRMVKTPAENLIFNLSGKKVPERTPNEREKSAQIRNFEDRLRRGEEPTLMLSQALEQGILTHSQVDNIRANVKFDPWVVKFRTLSVPEAEQVLALARPAERAKYAPLLEFKRANVRAMELHKAKSQWQKDRIGKPLTAAERLEEAQLSRYLRLERRKKKHAEQARRLALVAGMEE